MCRKKLVRDESSLTLVNCSAGHMRLYGILIRINVCFFTAYTHFDGVFFFISFSFYVMSLLLSNMLEESLRRSVVRQKKNQYQHTVLCLHSLQQQLLTDQSLNFSCSCVFVRCKMGLSRIDAYFAAQQQQQQMMANYLLLKSS